MSAQMGGSLLLDPDECYVPGENVLDPNTIDKACRYK